MKRSKFSLSNYKLLTCDQGELVPCGCFEVLPGDTVQQATSMLVRVTPLARPVMHPVQIRVHHWFVPTRIIWDDFEDFMTGGPDGMNADQVPFQTSGSGVTLGSLYDYFGIPVGVANMPFSVLPMRAYALTFNEFYRDQDLVTPLVVNTTSGADGQLYTLQKVAWEKDYFTSARPWSQKGPDVTVPMGTTAPVIPSGDGQPLFNVGGTAKGLAGASGNANTMWSASNATTGPAAWNATKLQADLTNAQAANINELRKAFALQRYAEARARYGSRYTEYLRYLGVRSSDARLQRPEYLGGGKQTIQFSEVLQTAPAAGGTGVGDIFGHGIGAMRSNRYRRFFEEHGYVISLLSVKPKTMYVQGLHRMFSRQTKEDFWQRELQHIGQQEILNKELYAAHTAPEGVFGYQDRYDEYRRAESSIAGEFRTILDDWHMARIFAADVTLNGAFITADPTKRIYQEQTQDSLWIMCNHSIQARRMVAGTGNSFIY